MIVSIPEYDDLGAQSNRAEWIAKMIGKVTKLLETALG